MFRRLLVTDLMNDFALITFAIFFLIFIFTAIWALSLPKKRVNHMANLPLESDQDNDEHHA